MIIRVVNGQATLALANRRLAFGIVLLMLLMWMFAVVTVLVMQAAFPAPLSAVEEYREPVIVVDSPLLSGRPGEAHLTASGAVDAAFDTNRQPVPAFAPMDDFNPAFFTGAQPENLYLRVATANSKLAGFYASYLTAKGIPAFTSDGPSGENSMLMVGPARDIAHLGELRGELRIAGLEPD